MATIMSTNSNSHLRQGLVAVVAGPHRDGSTSLALSLADPVKRQSTVVVFDLDPARERSAYKQLTQNRFKPFPDFFDWSQHLAADDQWKGIGRLNANACAYKAKHADKVFVVPCPLDAHNATRDAALYKAQLQQFIAEALPVISADPAVLCLFDLPADLSHPLTEAILGISDLAMLCQNTDQADLPTDKQLAVQAMLQPSKQCVSIDGDGIAHGFV